GQLEHRDSMGNREILPRGTIQFTSAGTGIRHSEMNASKTKPVHFLQLWSPPTVKRLQPSYATKPFTDVERTDRSSPFPMMVPMEKLNVNGPTDGEQETFRGVSLKRLIGIHQDLYMFSGLLNPGAESTHVPVGDDRKVFIHVVEGGQDGSVEVSTRDGSAKAVLKDGDGLFVSGVGAADELVIKSIGEGLSEFVLLDMTSAENPAF
ncbi:hypothetical protein HDU76_011699, partial [Blyttiomyces sp. JEL0837]